MRIASTTITNSRAGEIADALRSVVDVVDLCILIDTGIEDDTLDIARKICGKKLLVEKHTWSNNFSLARNYALLVALSAEADWAMTLDTDERIDWNGEDLRKSLEALGSSTSIASTIHMRDRGEHYAKERIFNLRALEGRRWQGRTHEFFPAVHCPELQLARFWELGKSAEGLDEKLRRDLQILEEETRDKPKESRWWFYLGETRRNLRNYREASIAYAKAFETTSWDEEAAWSKYLQAQCLVELGQLDAAIATCSEGMIKHAEIPELPWYAAWLCNKLGRHLQAVRWAKIAADMNERAPMTRRVGFSYPLALHDGPWDVLRWSLPAIGREGEAKEADEKRQVKMVARLTSHHRASFHANSHAHATTRPIPKLLIPKTTPKPAFQLFPTFSTQRIDFEPPAPFRAMNPSIVKDGGIWRCVVRTVNYHLSDDGGYQIADTVGPNIVETRNWMLSLDVDFAVGAAYPMPDMTKTPKTNFPIRGFEDLRIFHDASGKTRATAVVCDLPGNRRGEGMREIALLDLASSPVAHDPPRGSDSSEDSREAWPLCAATPLRGVWSYQHQKNWCPVEGTDQVIYSLEPLRVIRFRSMEAEAGGAGAISASLRSNVPEALRDFTPPSESSLRGGSQAILVSHPRIDGRRLLPLGQFSSSDAHHEDERQTGRLLLTHEVEIIPGKRRAYWHRFVLLDAKLERVIGLTPPFSFQAHEDIEFAAGLAIDNGPGWPRGERLVASYGVKDCEAWLGFFMLSEIMQKMDGVVYGGEGDDDGSDDIPKKEKKT